ncbi:MAG: hypothetical protein ACTTHG_00240 [Treponemataceae bacterium]
MINTYNESSLHKTLKNIYSLKHDGKTEVKIGKYICDVVTDDKRIFEIQSSNLSSLTKKTEDLLNQKYKVTIIYPLALTTIIKTVDNNGVILKKRKSPKTKNIFSIFGEIFSLYKIFDYENFCLTVVPISQEKTKTIKDDNVQSKQNSRRFKKNYLITDKNLIDFGKEIHFHKKEDFLAILPKAIPQIFCSKDLKNSPVKNEANKVIWVLKKMNLLEIDHKEKNLCFYKIKNT